MARLRRRLVTYEPVEVSKDDLISLPEASRKMNVTIKDLRAAILRGALTEVVDLDLPNEDGWLIRRELIELDFLPNQKDSSTLLKENRRRGRKKD